MLVDTDCNLEGGPQRHVKIVHVKSLFRLSWVAKDLHKTVLLHIGFVTTNIMSQDWSGLCCRPDTPDTACDVPGHLSPSSSHSSMLSGSPSPSNPPTLKAASPPTAQEGLHKPQSAPSHPQPTFRQAKHAQQQQPTQPSNPFAAAAMQAQSSSSDLDLSLEEAAASSSHADASMLHQSPKSMRTHVQHPLEESELQWEVANAAAPITPRVRLSMERAHSAGLWSRRRPIGSIPEDRPLASSPPKAADETAPRPIRKVSCLSYQQHLCVGRCSAASCLFACAEMRHTRMLPCSSLLLRTEECLISDRLSVQLPFLLFNPL